MWKVAILAVFFLGNVSAVFSKESIQYKLSMPEPHTHYFEVEMVLEGFKASHLDIKMPVWAPGSYLVREFSKNVDRFSAVGTTGEELNATKISKNTWRVSKGNANQVTISYSVYAYEMSVRTSFLDADHGYVNGSSVFTYVDGKQNLPHQLQVIPFEGWKKVSTSLPKSGNEDFSFTARDYDQLVDCPLEIGNHEEFSFDAAGIKHRVAMYGEGNYDVERLKTDLTNIIEGLTKMFDDNPNDDYLFIVHNLEKGSGGLEHLNSTTLQVNRWTYHPEGKYQSFLGLAAHEYFHLWVVKRLRPDALGPFDYDRENYTRLLWVMEGFTSYYSQLILCQLGYMSQTQFIEKLGDSFTSMENAPGNRVQPVSMSSFDAWIKAYRPDENSVNSQISYYQKGSVIAALLDVLIISNSGGKSDLGSALKFLYENHYKKNDTGFTDADMKNALEKFAGTNLDDFYERYIDGTSEIDYEKYMGLAGLQVATAKFLGDDEKKLGVNLSESGGKLTVRSVQNGTPAYKYGINASDEVLAVEGYRVNSSREINTVLENRAIGDTIEIVVARDGKIKTLTLVLERTEGTYYRLSKKASLTEQEENTLKRWLTFN